MHNLLFIVMLLIACAVKFGLGEGETRSTAAPVSAPAPNVLPFEGGSEPSIRPDTQPIRPTHKRARQASSAHGVSLPRTLVFTPHPSDSVPC
jgi:hypothetical protein